MSNRLKIEAKQLKIARKQNYWTLALQKKLQKKVTAKMEREEDFLKQAAFEKQIEHQDHVR